MLEGIHWVIVGGESGPRARPVKPEWVLKIREQCEDRNVPFFFKQWGAYNPLGKRVGKKAAGRVLDGRTWDQMPAKLRPDATNGLFSRHVTA
jgi:protein gp37